MFSTVDFIFLIHGHLFIALLYILYRQEVQELHAEAVRQQAEFEAWYKQQELLLQGEEQRRRILQEEENKLAQQRSRSVCFHTLLEKGVTMPYKNHP